MTSCLTSFQQSSPVEFPWERTITFHFSGAYLFSVQSTTRSQLQSLLMTFHDTVQYLNWAHRKKSIKSMFLIDLIEPKQSLPHISLMRNDTKTPALYESYFCRQALCPDLVTTAMMEGRWLLFKSVCITSSEQDTGLLIEACHTVHTAKWGKKQTNRATVVDSIKDPAISLWVSRFIILLLTHCHGALWFVLFYKITLIVRLVFLGPLCEGGGCGAEPLEVQQFIEIHEGRAC